ncbi:MAG: type IV pilus assembly protein PilM [Parcubacteria group bacterium]|nr:type IV pilus assembly protein PilM [Parcubacteria group bacterium]
MAEFFSSGTQSTLERAKGFVLDFVDDLLKRKSSSVVGVDIGSSSIKVVQLKKRNGKAVLETYGELSLGPYAALEVGQATKLPQEKVSEALKDLMREANVNAVAGGLAIPLSQSLLSIIEIPMVSERKIADMVPLEARRYIPVPISEVTLDWRVVPELDSSSRSAEGESEKDTAAKKVRVQIAAIHNEVIGRYSNIASTSGLAIDFLEIEAFSLIRALDIRAREAVLIIDIGAGSTKVVIAEGELPFRSHIINRGSQDITQALSKSLGVSILKAEEMKRTVGLKDGVEVENQRDVIRLIMQGIFSEANRILLDYERTYSVAVSRIVLSGGGSLLRGTIDLAKENFEVEVVMAHPFANVDIPAFMEGTLKEAGPSFSVALGIAMRKLQEIE